MPNVANRLLTNEEHLPNFAFFAAHVYSDSRSCPASVHPTLPDRFAGLLHLSLNNVLISADE